MPRPLRSTAFRLGASFAAILALFGIAALVELAALRRIAQAQDELARLDHAKHTGHRVASDVREQYIHQAHTIIVENTSHLDHYDEVVRAARDGTKSLVAIAESEDERRRAVEIARDVEAADTEFRRDVFPALERRDRATLLALHDETEKRVKETLRMVDALNGIFEARSMAALAETERIGRQARVATVACFGLAIVVAAGVGLLLMRSILRPIAALTHVAERVGAGDLQSRVEVHGHDELAALARTFNRMTEDLARHQEAHVRTQKLASIGQVAAGVAHEINNPLGVILGYVKILRKEPAFAGAEELGIIEDEAHQCQRIVQELLDLARPPRLELAAADLGEVAREAVTPLQEAGRLGSVAVEAPPADVAVPVRADEARLRQVIQNLVLNASQAGATRIRLDARAADAGGRLVISDDGPGMTPDVLAHAFDPFFTTKRHGTGLGLAIAQAIVDAHGGRLELASLPGDGTRVTLWLPRGGET
jgi:two-component system NtrC family sensor kinase